LTELSVYDYDIERVWNVLYEDDEHFNTSYYLFYYIWLLIGDSFIYTLWTYTIQSFLLFLFIFSEIPIAIYSCILALLIFSINFICNYSVLL